MVGVTQREERILELLRSGEPYSVVRLSEELGVSSVTIRNDLKNLDAKGLVVRTRGTAIAADCPQMAQRQSSRMAEKEMIARTAASFVKDNDTVMITNGSTCSLIARYLFGRKDVKVVTNSTLLLPYARANTGLRVTLIGGEFRPQAEAIVGPAAVAQIEDYHVPVTFFGTDGITIEHGLTTALIENADVVRRMCAQATKRILVVDSSKFGRRGFVRIMPITDIDTIITDAGVPPEAVEKLQDLGVEVIVAK